MSATPDPSPMGSISRVPYDILQKIFTHCLPQYPHHYRQPDITIAPILLCHICSSWRTVALGSATLWAHLSYSLSVIEEYTTDSISRTCEFTERDFEFIQWWKQNQASTAPLLNLDLYADKCSGEFVHKLVGERLDFLFEYIASAQYLWLDMLYWSQILERIEAGHRIVFPNLHTQSMESLLVDSSPFYQLQSFLSAQSQSALRRLAISEDALPQNLDIPNHWATLTEISMSRVSISLDFWFSLIRAVPNLQRGYFDIYSLFGVYHTRPPRCTMLQLTTLAVAVYGGTERNSLSLMFNNLYLPALRVLSLSTFAATWSHGNAIIELYDVLKSTPVITKLVLERNFLKLHVHDTTVLLASIEDVAPVWKHATRLVQLQLDMPILPFAPQTLSMKEHLETFVRNIFSSDNAWLDLQNPACPIQSITISSTRSTDFVMSIIRQNSEKAPRVIFQSTSVSTEQIAAEMQNEWRSIV